MNYNLSIAIIWSEILIPEHSVPKAGHFQNKRYEHEKQQIELAFPVQ